MSASGSEAAIPADLAANGRYWWFSDRQLLGGDPAIAAVQMTAMPGS